MKIPKLLAGLKLLCCLGISAFFLSSVHIVGAQAVVQGYGTTGNIQTGMILRLVAGQTGTVEPATGTSTTNIFGVAVNPSAADVTIASGTAAQTYVATSGTYEVLVSNQDGAIKSGDYVSLSSIDGIGMKADTTQPLVVGKAVGAFDGKTNAINTTSLKTDTGKELTVSIGEIPVSVAVGHNPLQQTQTPDVPGFLAHLAEATTQKPVNPVRLYLGLAVLGLTAIIVTVMLYSAVRSSIVSIGRNPLSKRSITKSMFQAVTVSVMIFIVGLFAVYLLLKV